MDLREYLFRHRIKIVDFSKELGCSRIHLGEVINKKRTPSLMFAKAIERATNGEVTVNELLGEHNG
jgi:DNA-binding transcriptional regulator YdaS (Cro superfamily)